MRHQLTRRGFLAASAALTATTALPRLAFAQSIPLTLKAQTRVIDVGGRAATVMGLTNGEDRQGLVLDPGQRFRVDLTNALDEETIIHWHGQIPPNVQDGVPNIPMPLLQPGETRSYDYAPMPGTHWMHSHVPVQEMSLLAAPLIVRRPEGLTADRQEVVMFLHDFAFRPAAEVPAEITDGAAHHDMGNTDTSTQSTDGMSGMDHSGVAMEGMMSGGGGNMGTNGMPMKGMDSHMPITARSGERVHLTFHNMSMMGHPMHLHGHVFQVVNINGRSLDGAIRDTVYVPPMSMVTVALDAGEAARWMLHCHHMPHLFTGMMTEFAVSA